MESMGLEHIPQKETWRLAIIDMGKSENRSGDKK
jgi:hypothetical protein